MIGEKIQVKKIVIGIAIIFIFITLILILSPNLITNLYLKLSNFTNSKKITNHSSNTSSKIINSKSSEILKIECEDLPGGYFIARGLDRKITINTLGTVISINPNNHIINYSICLYREYPKEDSPVVLAISNNSKLIPILKCAIKGYPYSLVFFFDGNRWSCKIPPLIEKIIKMKEGDLRYQCEAILKGYFIPSKLNYVIKLNISGTIVIVNPNNYIIMTPLCIYKLKEEKNSPVVLAIAHYNSEVNWETESICSVVNKTSVEIVYNGKEWKCR